MTGIARRHRKAIRSPYRRLNPSRQAMLVLVYLCKGETFHMAGTGFGVSTTTVWHHVEETVTLLQRLKGQGSW
ncbi:transposase family protein [Spongiactinospora sp. 9N601]|uniref:transposase family protein n=1 Tax=Spongiactinospora sp. 9N601 TaxID=3375149 RepID=UPI0037BC4893